MPWSPGFQTTVIGIQEARLVALKSLLQSKITDLNTTLQIGSLLPAGQATTANVVIGDPFSLDDSKAFTICVCMGGGRAGIGLDLDSEFKEIGVTSTISAIRYGLHTRIMVYIHPDTLPQVTQTISNVNTQCEKRELLLARICDWIAEDIFATTSGIDLTLTSQMYNSSGDNLTMQKITSINIGTYAKGYGGDVQVLGAEVLLSAVVQ